MAATATTAAAAAAAAAAAVPAVPLGTPLHETLRIGQQPGARQRLPTICMRCTQHC
jgi:hypothetical protein